MHMRIFLPLLFTACAGCGIPVLYEETKSPSASSLHIETHTTLEVYNSRVFLTTNNSLQPIFLGHLNSVVFGTAQGRKYLDTKIFPMIKLQTPYILQYKMISAYWMCFLKANHAFWKKTVRYCEARAIFTPMPFESYTITQDASGLPCKISISQNKDGSTSPVSKIIFAHTIFAEYNKEISEPESPSTSCVFEKNKSLNRIPEQKQEIWTLSGCWQGAQFARCWANQQFAHCAHW